MQDQAHREKGFKNQIHNEGRRGGKWNKSMQGKKDLRVIFDNLLTFDTHIYGAASKANRMLGIIERAFD